MHGRVLIVDDDTALLRALPQALKLRLSELEVDTAENASEALAAIRAVDYDAIVSDIKMPGMDGLALLREIGQIRPKTPTLLITGHGEHDLAVQALRGGAYDFVQKPIDRDYFVASLTRAVTMRQLDRAVDAQKVALERHAKVLEHVGEGVMLVDREGVIQLWNPAAAAITGVDAADVRGRPVGEVLDGWNRVVPLIPVGDAPGSPDDGAATVPVEVGERELWLSVAGVRFDDGTVYTFRNLSEERALDELKGDFVATVSHELRTPLAAIYGSAETLRRSDVELDEPTRRRLLAIISHESERLSRIVTDILLTTNLDSGQMEVARDEVDLTKLVREVAEALQPRLAEKQLSVDLDSDDSLPPVAADPDKLRQVLVNVLDNAIKYSPQGGAITIRSELEHAHARLAVHDDGAGIPRHEQRRIFGKFYRVDPNLSEGVGGTGLGLYICKEILRRMNGRIGVESEEGGGATFFIDVPLARVAFHRDIEQAQTAETDSAAHAG